MKYLLTNQEIWIVVHLKTPLIGMAMKALEKLKRKSRSVIQLSLVDSMLLNVFREDTTKKLWDKLGNLY